LSSSTSKYFQQMPIMAGMGKSYGCFVSCKSRIFAALAAEWLQKRHSGIS